MNVFEGSDRAAEKRSANNRFQRTVLFANSSRAIGGAPREIQIRHIGNCLKADPAYGKEVADALGIRLGEQPKGK